MAIPSVDHEAARDLIRAREDCRSDLMRFGIGSRRCCCHGIVYYGGQAWTGKHDTWLRLDTAPQLTTRATWMAFDSGYETVLAVKAPRSRTRG